MTSASKLDNHSELNLDVVSGFVVFGCIFFIKTYL